jgi:esterase/lipase superfamily enzyme
MASSHRIFIATTRQRSGIDAELFSGERSSNLTLSPRRPNLTTGAGIAKKSWKDMA